MSHSSSPRVFLSVCLLLLVTSCESSDATASLSQAVIGLAEENRFNEPLSVVCTIGILGDITAVIAGERAEVSSLMGPGVDPHLYKTSPGDVRKLLGADLILHCGFHLEGRMSEVLKRVGSQRDTVAVCEEVPRDRLVILEAEGSLPSIDPHLWFDVQNWMEVCRIVKRTLSRIDPIGKPGFEKRCSEYLEELSLLDREVLSLLATIPRDHRVLITAHDAFGYLGRAYDLEVIGVQGLSTDSEASVATINRLVSQISRRKIPAVFVETTVSQRNIEALIEGCQARGHPLRLGGKLFSDALGAGGTPEGTYVGMIRHNARVITEGLR
ncbi:MAG TPA: manganese transporter [Planctomycetes bacterium]|nr:manganese transporter [Planctomycetota bacterium]HIN80095.1 manganese transporter [Planctomycetota bacterium]